MVCVIEINGEIVILGEWVGGLKFIGSVAASCPHPEMMIIRMRKDRKLDFILHPSSF